MLTQQDESILLKIERKIEVIALLRDRISSDLDEITDGEIKELLHQRLRELYSAEAALMLKINQLRNS